jgi:integrase
VRVYAGVDPVSKRRHYLTEIVAAGPGADRRARAVRDRLVSQVEERRTPRTKATVDQLLERYLDQFDGAASTLTLYRGYVRNHISPFLGKIKASALDADILDSFYVELRRCRAHCSGRPFVQHRTAVEHRCDHRCGQTVGCDHYPAHAFHPVRCLQARGALEVGDDQFAVADG